MNTKHATNSDLPLLDGVVTVRSRAMGLMFALVFSLALSPLLSRMHHVVHPGHGMANLATQSAEASDSFQIDRLFGQHADGSQVCQLLDHSTASDGPLSSAPALLSCFSSLPLLALSQDGPKSGWIVFFEARGPPLFL